MNCTRFYWKRRLGAKNFKASRGDRPPLNPPLCDNISSSGVTQCLQMFTVIEGEVGRIVSSMVFQTQSFVGNYAVMPSLLCPEIPPHCICPHSSS